MSFYQNVTANEAQNDHLLIFFIDILPLSGIFDTSLRFLVNAVLFRRAQERLRRAQERLRRAQERLRRAQE